MISPSLARYGTVSAEQEDRILAAGPLEIRLQGCTIQSVRFHGRDMLGGLAFLVRDRGWGTVPVAYELAQEAIRPDGFTLGFACTAQGIEIDLSWETRIEASAEGRLTVAVRGRANRPTTTNRAGFVALHPTGWAGARADAGHPDGGWTVGILPRDVDPEPCFGDIARLQLAQDDAWIDLAFDGGTWEMEDQRNWLDASFKTYFRPLSLPYPYDIAGEFFQSVTAKFGCTAGIGPAATSSASVIDVGQLSPTTTPRLGLRSDGRYLADELTNASMFAELGPFTLHAALDLRSPEWRHRFSEVGMLSSRTARPVCLEVIPDLRGASGAFGPLADALRKTNLAVESLLVSLPEDAVRLEPGPPVPPQALLLEIHRQARAAFPGVTIGGGTLGFFAELNRNWPPLGLVDFVAHTSSSTVHAADVATMTENIASYAGISDTVKAVCGGLPHRWISATLGVLDNPYNPPNRSPWSGQPSPMREFDPRHGALFGAAWTLASYCALARANAAEMVPACLCGPAGILWSKLETPQPWYDEKGASQLYPLYHVVRALSRFAGAASLTLETSRPIHAIGRAAPGQRYEFWLTNLSAQSVDVEVRNASDLLAVTLDETSFEQAATIPDFLDRPEPSTTPQLQLRPYAICHATFFRRS